MAAAAGGAPLSVEEREALWREAWLMVRRHCGGTLSRLRRGWGGWYDADDFYQDCYLAFEALLERWARQGLPAGELWSAWRCYLWRGGGQILRRPPQRLGVREPCSVADLAGLLDAPEAPVSDGLARAVLEQLVERADPLAQLLQREERGSGVALLARLLEGLPVGQRALLRARYLQGMSVAELACRLGVSPAVVHSRTHRALATLRRRARQMALAGACASPCRRP